MTTHGAGERMMEQPLQISGVAVRQAMARDDGHRPPVLLFAADGRTGFEKGRLRSTAPHATMAAMDDHPEPTEAEQLALIAAQFEDGGRRFAERAEKNPWTHGLRAVLAIGDQGLIDDFVRRFKADFERRFPEAERRAREAKLWPR